MISTRQMKYDQIPPRLGVAVYCAAPYKLWLEVARTLYGPLISDWAAYHMLTTHRPVASERQTPRHLVAKQLETLQLRYSSPEWDYYRS